MKTSLRRLLPSPLRMALPLSLALSAESSAVMYNIDTGNQKSIDLANLQPFTSRANIPGCSAVLIAPNVALCAAHCTNYAASGTTTVTWNGQSRSGAAFTRIGADHMLVITTSPFTGTLGRMTAPYHGSAELDRLAWKVGSGGNGIIGTGGTGPFYDGIFRAMTNRIEVNNVSSPPNPVTTDYLYYDFDGPPSQPSRPTTFYEGGTAPGDSGGPLYMYENGRWYVIGVTSGPDAGFYRDGRVRTDLSQIQSLTGYTWATPTTPQLAMRWVAQDLTATVSNGAPVTSWTRQGGSDVWSPANGGAGTTTLVHSATPRGTAAVDFPGTASLGLPASSNPVASQSAFTVAMVVRVDAAGTGAEDTWSSNTGLLDADETGTTNDWGLALSSTGKPALGVGNADTTLYSSGSSIVGASWRVIVATYDGSEVTGDAAGTDRNMNLYVDSVTNVSRRQGPEFINVNRNSASLTLGGSRSASRFFDGAVAEVRLYRGALDEASVASVIRELQDTHINAQASLTLTSPSSSTVTTFLGQSLIINGTAGTGSTIAVTQNSGPATATLNTASQIPCRVTFPATGAYRFTVTSTSGTQSVSRSFNVNVLATPESLSGIEVGSSALPGSFTRSGGTFTINAAGTDIAGSSDQFHFVRRSASGDFRLQARVNSITSGDAGAKAGVMFRESTAAGSRNVFLAVTRSNGITRQFRTTTSGTTTANTTASLSAPFWIRLERRGNEFSSFRSTDGISWTAHQPAVTLDLPTTTLVGLAFTSRTATALGQAVFDNVTFEPIISGTPSAPSDPFIARNLGDATVTGSEALTSNPARITGSGAGFQEMSDSIKFVSKPLRGDGSITIRATAFDSSNGGLAFGGIMMRSGLLRQSANVAATVVAGGASATAAVRFTRRTEEAFFTESSSENFGVPHWLRLTRTGNSFSCFRSADGIDWTQVGTAVTLPDAPAVMEAGVVVASLNNNGPSGFSFTNLSLEELGTSDIAPIVVLAPGQNPSVANNFTLTATSDRTATWAWEKISGPGTVTFRTQNTPSPQVSFSQAGSYVIRATATANGISVSTDQSFDLKLDARWNFNTDGDLEGWAGANPSTFTATNGIVSATATSGDPQFIKNAATFVSGALAKQLLVRYRASTTGTSQLFWGRVGAGSFTGSRSVTAPYSPANTWRIQILNTGSHAEWAPHDIIDLRFDPAGTTGTVMEIDWIALSDGDLDGDGIPDATDPLPDDPTDPNADNDGDGVPDSLETTRYWNADPLSATWQTGTSTWNTGPLGTGTQSTWNTGDDGIFDRPSAYTVTLGSTLLPGRATLQAGQVTFAGTGSLGASSVSILSGATLTLADTTVTTGTGPISLLGTLAVTKSADTTLSGTITGAGSLSKTGAGTLILSGPNTFGSGTLAYGVNGTNTGAIRLASNTALGNYTNISLSGANTTIRQIQLSGGISCNYNVSATGVSLSTTTGAFLANVSGNNSWNGSIGISGTGGGYGIRSDAGSTLTINGNVGGSLGGASARTYDFHGAGNIIINGVFSNTTAGTPTSLGINKSGTGTLTLAAANTFTHTTTITGGTLRLTHLSALANSPSISLATATRLDVSALNGWSLASSQTLLGSGEVLGSPTILGTLSPGLTNGAIANLTFLENLTLQPTSTLIVDVAANGASCDKLIVTGTLNATGSITFNFGTFTPVAGNQFDIADAATTTGTPTITNTLPAGLTWDTSLFASSGILRVVSTASPFATWATGFGLTGNAALPDADPDNDGINNLTEFALNGNPLASNNTGLLLSRLQDASPPTGQELTLLVAVRRGATFTQGPSNTQTATIDGITYTVEGTLNLATFDSPVSRVSSADTATSMPPLTGTAWEYHLFKLNNSEGLTGKGFLRVKIQPAP